jgi:hypothetical protein
VATTSTLTRGTLCDYNVNNTTWTCTSTSSDSDNPWYYWTGNGFDTGGTTTCSNTNAVWVTWNASGTYIVEPVAETEEERTARHEVQARADQERAAAKARARELLLAHLTEAQRKTFIEKGWFIVEGGKTKKAYRIHTDKFSMNIYELQAANDNAPPVCNLCAHVPTHLCPVEDNALAQKLMIETAEDEFRRVAVRRAA